MKDLISVIVPVFNAEKYLKPCIDSILNQTYKNLEIILVDDGSTDSSGMICDEYAKIDNRIVVIHKKNGGVSETRNIGIQNSHGRYISFVDADDVINCDMIKTLVSDLIEYNADISIINFKIVMDDFQSGKFNNKKGDTRLIEKEEALFELLKGESIENYLWNKLYKKELFNDISFKVGKTMEDLDVMYLLIDKSNVIVFNSKVLYYYYNRDGSIVNTLNPKLLTDKFYASFDRYKYLSEKYPKMLENYAFMLKVILEIYQFFNIDKLNEDFAQKLDEALKEINSKYKGQVLMSLGFKYKIKYIVLLISPNLYKGIFKKFFGKL